MSPDKRSGSGKKPDSGRFTPKSSPKPSAGRKHSERQVGSQIKPDNPQQGKPPRNTKGKKD